MRHHSPTRAPAAHANSHSLASAGRGLAWSDGGPPAKLAVGSRMPCCQGCRSCSSMTTQLHPCYAARHPTSDRLGSEHRQPAVCSVISCRPQASTQLLVIAALLLSIHCKVGHQDVGAPADEPCSVLMVACRAVPLLGLRPLAAGSAAMQGKRMCLKCLQTSSSPATDACLLASMHLKASTTGWG